MLRSQKAVILSALAGFLLTLSFPSWDYSYFAFFALIPLFYACENQHPCRAFFLGWFTGLIYFAGTLYWVTISMHQYGNLPWAASIFFMLLFCVYLAVYVGFFTLLIHFSKKRLLLVAPFAWTALEYLRGHLLTGFPWNALGYSQYRNLPLIQIADIASVYGVSALIVFFNVALFVVLQTAWDKKVLAKFPSLILSTVLALTLLYGFYRLSQPMGNSTATAGSTATANEKPLRVAVIQGNIDQAIKWSPEAREKTLKKYEQLSLPFLQHADLVIWPEAALPVFFQNEPLYQQRLVALTQKGNLSLLFGSPAFKATESGQISLLNSAYLLPPSLNGPSLFRYDKMHLVPFGEYVPFKSALFFVDKMVTGIGDFVPGNEATVMEIPSAKIGTAICFEVIFPEVVRKFVKNGANVMVTITNDAWFGRSSAPYQHFSMVVFRAIENRVPFARAANSGISGFIDAHGTVLQSSAIFAEEGRLENLSPGFQKTVYTMYGDFFAIGSVIFTFIFIGFVVYERRFVGLCPQHPLKT